MKAADFSYQKPRDLCELLALLDQADREVQVIAGGQSLMPMMNFRLAQPEVLIDLNAIAELQAIEDKGNAIRIGAMVRFSQLQSSKLIQTHVPLFSMALPHIAHAAIRNRGTIGGSAALADPAAEMPALLLVLNATMILLSKRGERSVGADDFFLGLYETALEDDEIIGAISIPKAASTSRYGFYELARRHGDYATAGVAIAMGEAAPLAQEVRVAWFSVADRAIRLPAVERALQGCPINDPDALIAARQVLDDFDFEADLNADSPTKRHFAAVVLKRALEGMAT